ncbi:hypothetical protein TCON_2462 [Astathelohania contejeani]|uniref:Uncharacterized protein n=1 Tax=Astathelohania contejeani TaxID=164912 RepID=A0ABQ7HVX6_9MICR|nr:hypothetical protein TCON_2462 [Thelohania contejeani]
MFNYLSVIDNSLYLIKGNKIIKDGQIILEHTCEFTFIKQDIIVDSSKQIYVFENAQLKSICKAKRSITQIIKENNIIYWSDRFGDVYKYDKNTVLILGNMSYITDMVIYKDFLCTSDKYGRVRISDKNTGFIFEYLFLYNKPITSMINVGSYLVIGGIDEFIKLVQIENGIKEIKKIKCGQGIIKLINLDGNKFCGLWKNKIMFFDHDIIIKEQEGDFIDTADGTVFLCRNGSLWKDNKEIYNGNMKYDTFLNHLENKNK